jgi:hypothetical protein
MENRMTLKEENSKLMVTSKAFYQGINQYSFRSGELAEIIGIATCHPENGIPRVCFIVKYADEKMDYCPVLDTQNYNIYTDEEIRISYVLDPL